MPLFLLPLALAAAIQSKSSDKLPPANPLPPPASEEGQVMAPVTALLAGIAARDAAAIGVPLRDDSAATVASQAADGTHKVTRLTKAQLLARFSPGPERFEERLTDPAVEIDGDIAMVWSPYLFLIDGKVHHCGVDHFDLVREGGSWTIANITWSSRMTDCAAQ
jgi:hypothetical protein